MSPYSSSIKLAGRRGWQPVSANFIGAWSVKTHWEVYEAAAKEHGHEVDREMWRVARSITWGESDQEAEDFVKTPNGAFDFYYRYLFAIFERAQMMGAFVINPEDSPDNLTSEDLQRQFRDLWQCTYGHGKNPGSARGDRPLRQSAYDGTRLGG